MRLQTLEQRRRFVVAITGACAFLAALPPTARAATYTYTPTNTATESWSSGANWNAVPTSAADTILTFMGLNATVFPNSVANVNNNDVANPFSLNVLNLQGTGPATGAGTITIGGSALQFVASGGTNPVVNLNALKGTAGLSYTNNAPITLVTNITFTGDGTAGFVLKGAISGAGSLTKYGASTLELNGDSSGTFSGPIYIRGGTIKVNVSSGGKLPATQVVTFDGVSSTFGFGVSGNSTVGTFNFQRGNANIANNMSASLVTTNSARSRSTGATVGYSYNGGSPGSTTRIALAGQAAGFIDGATFVGTAHAFYDTNSAYVRAMNYSTDTIAQNVNGDFTATSDIGNTTGVANKHTQITPAAGTATTANGAGSGTSLTLTDASSFQVGQTLAGTGINKGTYIAAKAGNTLTLSQANTVINGASITPYSGINNQSTITLNTLRFATDQMGSLRLAAGQTLTLSDGGIITDGNKPTPWVISGGAGIQAGLDKELVILGGQGNNMLVIASPILANGVNALVKSGNASPAPILRLEGANTFTGGVYLNGGVIHLASVENPGVSGPLGAGGAIYFYGGQLYPTAANGYDYSPRFSTAANQNFNVDTAGASVTWAANLVSDNGILTYNPAGGALTLTGTNTYNGGTVFTGGTLILGSDSALGTGPVTFNNTSLSYVRNNSPTATRTLRNALAINTIQNLYFGVQDNSNIGSLVFTGPVTFGANVTLLAGSSGTTAGQTAVGFEGGIGDGGAGSTLSLPGNTSGTGAGLVFLLGTNTYSGRTTIGTGGGTVTVIANSLGNAGVAGSLGAPTGANATIRVTAGAGTTTQGTLRYVGGTTSTDRTIDMASTAGNVNGTLDASGSGPITFTSIAASGASGGATSRNLYLTGVNTNANTISGAIPAGYNGNMKFTKNGLGTWVLSGANAFTNGMTVNAGRLVLDHTLNAAVVNSANTLTLGGSTLEFRGKPGAFSTSTGLSNVTTTAASGLGTIALDRNGGSGTAVTLGAITASAAQSALLFDLGDPANSMTVATSFATPNLRVLIRDGNGRVDIAANAGVSTALAPLNATTDLIAVPVATTDYRLTGNLTVTASALARSLRIAPSADNQTLTLTQGTSTANTQFQLILMTGTNAFTITQSAGQTGSLSAGTILSTAAPQIYHFGTGKLTLDTKLAGNNGAASTGFVEFYGTGLVDLTRPANSSGAHTIGGVTLRQGGTNGLLLDATASGLGSGNILLCNGGVLEISSATGVTRSVSATAGGIQWAGDGGFSAFGGTRTVSLSNGVSLAWGTASFVPAANALVLSSPYADGTIDFQNGLNFINQQRVVDVRNGSSNVDARLSGTLTGRYGGGLIKRGTGALEVTAANDYQGETWVEGGTLLVNNAAGSGTGSGTVSVRAGAALAGSGVIAGSVNVASNATLTAGAAVTGGIGTLTVNGNLTVAQGATYAWEYQNGVGDRVAVNGTLTLPTSLTLNITSLGGSMPNPVTLFTGGTFAGATNLTGWTVTGVPPGYAPKIVGNTVIIRPVGLALIIR